MLEKKTLLVLGGTFVAIVALIWWGLQTEEPIVDDPNAIVYYYGEECPHCLVVQEWLDANAIADKVDFVKKEVWHDTKNANELERRAKACNIQPEGMGVPFVYGGNGQCYVGEPDVKKFFSEKAGLEGALDAEAGN